MLWNLNCVVCGRSKAAHMPGAHRNNPYYHQFRQRPEVIAKAIQDYKDAVGSLYLEQMRKKTLVSLKAVCEGEILHDCELLEGKLYSESQLYRVVQRCDFAFNWEAGNKNYTAEEAYALAARHARLHNHSVRVERIRTGFEIRLVEWLDDDTLQVYML